MICIANTRVSHLTLDGMINDSLCIHMQKGYLSQAVFLPFQTPA